LLLLPSANPAINKQQYCVLCGRAMPQNPPTHDQLAARRQLSDNRRALRDRKRDTRRKVVAGAVVLAHAGCDPAFRHMLCGVLLERLSRPQDRALFTDLLDG
jgi:hypothetical protein